MQRPSSVPDALVFAGWDSVAQELGIFTRGQSAHLLFQFISLTEEINANFAAGQVISDADMVNRARLIRKLSEALQVSMAHA